MDKGVMDKGAMDTGKRFWALRAALSQAWPWLIALGATDAAFILLAWLAYPETFHLLVGLMFIISLAIILATLTLRAVHCRRIPPALAAFLLEPDEEHEQRLARLLNMAERRLLHELGEQLRATRTVLTVSQADLEDYATSIEQWVHEIKTPLALMLLVLGNRTNEMSPLVAQRMTHVHSRMTADIETILYFARLRAPHKDYVFEALDLVQVLGDALDTNQASLEEARVAATIAAPPAALPPVTSDRKALAFILNQIIANAVKHATHLRFELEVEEGEWDKCPVPLSHGVILRIIDDGPGVASFDLPFIFEKGFTGIASAERSTGLGLYLVARQAHDLGVTLTAASGPPTGGLTLTLHFPL